MEEDDTTTKSLCTERPQFTHSDTRLGHDSHPTLMRLSPTHSRPRSSRLTTNYRDSVSRHKTFIVLSRTILPEPELPYRASHPSRAPYCVRFDHLPLLSLSPVSHFYSLCLISLSLSFCSFVFAYILPFVSSCI